MHDLKSTSQVKIVDITRSPKYEKYLYKCLASMPFRRYENRRQYLTEAVPGGLHKKVLLFDGAVVGAIEYAPAEASGYPISGEGVIVMNCIWVLRKAKRHGFGRLLLEDMMKSEKDAKGFAAIALENHWSPWFRKGLIERLGFRPLDSVTVSHATKHKGQYFNIYLMWMPVTENAKAPGWDLDRLLHGETFCIAHPLYHPRTWEENILKLEKKR